jgi:hypothetical protein
MPAVDVFVDLSGLPAGAPPLAAIARLERPDRLGGIAGRIFCAVPDGFPTPDAAQGMTRVVRGRPVQTCSVAMAAAADVERPLLALLGPLEPSGEAVGVMLQAVDDDAMIGFAIPRLTGERDDSLALLDRGGDPAIAELPRRLIAELPETYLVADAPARCLLIAPGILTNFAGLDERFRSVAGALWHYVSRARRCGFRTLVCNRAVVGGAPAKDRREPCVVTLEALPSADRVLLRDLVPDAARAHQEFGTAPIAPAETRLARSMPACFGLKPSLLLDVRNIGRSMNGTTIAALGIAGGLKALEPEWEIALLARGDASAQHELEQRFPDWRVHTKVPAQQFTVALRLSQPWQIEEMVDLHAIAATNLYLFLDTISWDVAYPAPRHLDGAWRFMADHADGLVFISAFTCARFQRRFAGGSSVPTCVSHLSFDPADYLRPDVVATPGDGPIFVVGNGYDHKDVAATIDVLSSAFPYQSIVALGPAPAPTPRVAVLESGTVSEVELHRLYAGAKVVVFPSFYEGFGFPIVTALAYGQTLLARRSALLDEIAARCAPRGRLIPYGRREELVEMIGRVLHGQAVPQATLGTALNAGRPKSWRDVAADILRFAGELTADPTHGRWRARDHTIHQLRAAR